MGDDTELRQRVQRLETLLQDTERFADPAARAAVKEIVQTLLDFHGAGLTRILECVAGEGEAGRRIVEKLAGDELVGSLFLLYDLHPLDLEARVRQALDSVRPYLRSHGGNVELVGVAGAAVRLRLQGSCNGCPSSAQTLRDAIEGAVYAAAPEVTAIEVEAEPQAAPPPGTTFVSVEQLLGKKFTAPST